MTDSDFGTFERALGRVSGAYQMRWKAGQFEGVTQTYFRCLEAWPIDDVITAGKVCIQTLKHFPKAAEWIAALETEQAHRQRRATAQPQTWRPMTDDQCTIRAHADRLRYEDTPCGCPACVEADVADRPIRFVPTLLDGIEDRVRWRGREDSTVAGHWAHGEELARYYAAKEACIAGWPRKFRRVLQLVTREIGEEG